MPGSESSLISQQIFRVSFHSDDDLVARVRERGPWSEAALEALLRRYDRPIYRACMAYLRNPDLAEEASQEVLIRVYRGIGRFQGRSSFRTWLYRIVRNECYSVAVDHSRHRARETVDEAVQDQLPAASSFTEDVELGNVVQVVLERLPARDREVIELRFFHDLSIRTIAGRLEVSLSSAKMRLYRAVSRFERTYLELEPDSTVPL